MSNLGKMILERCDEYWMALPDMAACDIAEECGITVEQVFQYAILLHVW